MRKELLAFRDPKSPISEVFRTLRTNIQFMNTDKRLRTLLMTSTFPGEGKSLVTSNLAVTFAQAGKRVILVDADMRKGRQYNIFGVSPKPGLSNYLSNMNDDEVEDEEVDIADFLQETEVENLHLLVAGNVPPNPSELLVSSRMRKLLRELTSMCDIVIIDGTPCDLVTDSIILSRFVDSTVIVTAQKETKKDALSRIVKNIQNVGGKIAGVVVNKVDISIKKYNESYYYGSTSTGRSSKRHSSDSKSFGSISNMFKSDDEDEEYENDFDDRTDNEVPDFIKKKQETKFEVPEIDEKEERTYETSKQEDVELPKSLSNNFNNVEKADSAKNMSEEKTKEILKKINEYIESEKQKNN